MSFTSSIGVVSSVTAAEFGVVARDGAPGVYSSSPPGDALVSLAGPASGPAWGPCLRFLKKLVTLSILEVFPVFLEALGDDMW